jgi:hypothetical protein
MSNLGLSFRGYNSPHDAIVPWLCSFVPALVLVPYRMRRINCVARRVQVLRRLRVFRDTGVWQIFTHTKANLFEHPDLPPV